MPAQIEHLNFTVPDPDATAAWLCDVFGWHIRWQGDAIHGGRSVHVGTDDTYVAVYNPGKPLSAVDNSYTKTGGLNHLGITVDDLDATEARVKAQGFETYSHANYDPGRRFYFRDDTGIEFEVVEY